MYFRCQLIPKDWPSWCARMYMIHCPHDSTDSIVFHNELDHTHNEIMANKPRKRILSPAMVNLMNDLFEKQTTQYASVIKHIESERKKQNLFLNEQNPTRDQVAYRLRLYREKEVKPLLNLGELMSWCKDHSNTPNDEHTPFVIDHWRERNNGTGLKFRFVFTTLYLLNLFKSVEKVCIDSTYKLNWCDFPLTILGTVDRNKKFHPIAFACSTNETTDDYAFVFDAVKKKIKECFSANFAPSMLISDAADAIRNGFYRIFPDATVDIMCFAHVLRNIEKRKFNSKNNKKLIIDDIKKLQHAPDKTTFSFMSTLFCEKWAPVEQEFVAYFKAQWLGVHCNWYEGAAMYAPSTNNAQESVNNVIKRKITLRRRLPMNQFLASMSMLISDMSKELCNGSRIFAIEPFIQKNMWREAIIMQQNSFSSFKIKPMALFLEHLSFIVPSSNCANPTIASYKTLLKQKWKTFDEYVQHGFQQFYLVNLKPSDSWKKESNCMCVSFMKEYICKHIIAVALREGITECPDEAEPILLSNKRRNQGRAKQAEPALVIGCKVFLGIGLKEIFKCFICIVYFQENYLLTEFQTFHTFNVERILTVATVHANISEGELYIFTVQIDNSVKRECTKLRDRQSWLDASTKDKRQLL